MSIDNSRFDPEFYPLEVEKDWQERIKSGTVVVGSIVQLTNEEANMDLETLLRHKDKEENMDSIKFIASVAKVTTLPDGGIRVVFDLDESGCQVMRALAECQQNGVALKVEAIAND